MARNDKMYDLMVFGVTGYTGKFVAKEINRIQSTSKPNLKWAVAGRTESKVRRVLQGKIQDARVISK